MSSSSQQRAFTPNPMLLSQVPRTRDMDVLVGILLTTNPAVPLRRKWDAAVRMESYLPAYVYGSLLRIAMAVAGKEAVEAEALGEGREEGEPAASLALAKRILRDLYEDMVRNVELARKMSPELNLDAPPALDDVWSDARGLLENVKAMSRAISDYYVSQVVKWEKAKDLLMYVYASARLAAAIVDPIRAYMSALS
mgnify:CR=1 FL=1